MIDTLLLLSGNDVPFIKAGISIHQPSLKEIAYVGQKNFYIGCQYLTFSKNVLTEKDKNHLIDIDDFEILMTTIRQAKSVQIDKIKTCMQMVLILLFPEYKVDFLPMSIMLSKKEQDKVEQHFIQQKNFEDFKNILKEIFCLTQVLQKDQYNPGGPQAQALVQKFKKRHKKLAEMKSRGRQSESVSVLSQYISILSIGLGIDENVLLNYSIYQLFDSYNRFRLKVDYDLFISIKLAGGEKDSDQIKNWMSDIHSQKRQEDKIL